LTKEGLSQLVAIKAAINWGLSAELKEAFPGVISVDRPLIIDQKIQDPNWLAGFTSGEGCFYVNIYKSSRAKFGVGVRLEFSIAQDNRDEALLQSLISYLNCGYLKKTTNYSWGNFVVIKFSEIDEKLIPFFRINRVLGVKSQDFDDWCKVAEIMRNKGHSTQEGLDQIRKIKSGMNKGRTV
jgi:hypothetical protein